jgi:metallophosphoesterase (TIGR00282 family)
MRLLFFGDVVGRSGRDALMAQLPALKRQLAADVVVVNVDNAAGGFGVSGTICRELLGGGADVLTGGDHIWDQKDILPTLAQEKRLLRPQNYPEKTPGHGHYVLNAAGGKRVLVVHVMGQVFMRDQVQCPFAQMDHILSEYRLGKDVSAIVVDFHAEATSEKMAMGVYLDGRVSMVVGSHTHVPTHDARVLPKGTAYQTDAGMCGDYDSVIGFESSGPLLRFTSKLPKVKIEPAQGVATLCGVLVETDDATGLAKSCRPVQYPPMCGEAV